MKTYDVTVLGELLIDFTEIGDDMFGNQLTYAIKGALRVMPKLEEISHVQRGV